MENLITQKFKTVACIAVLTILSACAVNNGGLSDSLSQMSENKTELPAVDFSGSWEIDHKMTENPRDKIKFLYDVAKSQIEQQQRSQGKNRGQATSLRNIGAINDLRAVIGLGTLAEAITKSTILTIEQNNDYIVVKRDGDYALTCEFAMTAQEDNQLGKEYCRFDKSGQVVFVVALPEGLTVMNRMVMSKDRSRLNVATTLNSAQLGQNFTLNRVYMPFTPGKGMYKCKYTLKDKKTCWLGGE